MADTVGQTDIRGENVSKIVKVFAAKKFKLKPLLLNISSNKWTESYYKQDPTILTAQGSRNIRGISRLSEFPTVERSWTLVQGQHEKYGDEGKISMEDILTNAINVQMHTMQGIAESIANSIDIAIYAALTGEGSTSGTNNSAIEWDSATVASRDPIGDILKGIEQMSENNIDALEGGILLLNPHDYRSLLMNSKVINNPSFKNADVVSNGKVGQIACLTIVVSTTVTADEAMIIINQQTATWQSVVGMTTALEKKEGIHTIIRSWEIGQIQITNPKKIYTIENTTIET